MAKKVRDIMTSDCTCVGEKDSLVDAAKLLAKLNVGALPICGEDDRLKGMLTDRDIVVKAVASGKDLSSTTAGELGQGDADPGWGGRVAVGLVSICLVAYLVALWAMTTKPV